MPLVGLPPAFVPPVVAVPAANAIVPFVAGTAAAGGGAAVASAAAAPLLVGALAGVAVLTIAYGVAQLWGQVNSRPKPTKPQVFSPIPGTTTPIGNTAPGTWTYAYGPVTWQVTNPSCELNSTIYSAAGVPSGVSRTSVISVSAIRYLSNACGVYRRELTLGFAGGLPDEVFSLGEVGGGGAFRNYQGPEVFTWSGPGAVPFVDKPPGATYPEAYVSPQFQPAPLQEPAKTPPIPLPYAPATVPEAEPTQQPAPARPARPVVAPPVTRPVPVTPAAVPRTTTPTTPSGQVQPAPQLPPIKTPTTVHVVNGTQIPGNGPQATPQGIAQELGRIENKLARLIDPKSDQAGQAQDRLGWLRDNIGNIIDFFLSTSAGGEYRISSPCVLDEEGQRVERVVEYEGSLQSFGVISNKIDALAALLQEHKDLKQPICRETPATGGQAVTVNFVQID